MCPSAILTRYAVESSTVVKVKTIPRNVDRALKTAFTFHVQLLKFRYSPPGLLTQVLRSNF